MMQRRSAVSPAGWALALSLAGSLAGGARADAMVFPGADWTESAPEAQGVDSAKLAAAMQYVAAKSTNLAALEATHNIRLNREHREFLGSSGGGFLGRSIFITDEGDELDVSVLYGCGSASFPGDYTIWKSAGLNPKKLLNGLYPFAESGGGDKYYPCLGCYGIRPLRVSGATPEQPAGSSLGYAQLAAVRDRLTMVCGR
jgi:hypothetical protein